MATMSPPVKATDDEIIDFIEQFLTKNGWPPTVREIGAAVGLSSTSAVKARLDQLAANGRLISTKRHSTRTLKMEVVR